MSKIIEKTVPAFGKGYKVMVECFDSANEVVQVSANRKVTNYSFHDFDNGYMPSRSWSSVGSFQEAKELMATGYQPTVDKLKGGLGKVNLGGHGKRISFYNDVVGFQPIVPLALQGVPNCMQNSYMKPIKAKVLNVYYDMTASSGTDKEKIIRAGQNLLAAIMELEMQGYKFNLYAIQSYSNERDADILCTKIKSSNTPLDLKRISFPLTHPAYFRVIGFDWYSKTPKGKYRSRYGRALGYDHSEKVMQEGFKQIFGNNCIVFSAANALKSDSDRFKNVILENSGKVVG